MNEQASLTDFSETQEDVSEHTSSGDDGSLGPDLPVRPDDTESWTDPLEYRLSDRAVMNDRSCPWCLEPADGFRVGGPTGLACTNCNSPIPKDADWYRNGEKIIL